MICRALIAATAFLAAAALAHAQTSAPWPTHGWASATPESSGMDAGVLAAMVEFGAATQMDSLLVVRHGRIVREVYFPPFAAGARHRINSATKGITAALVGAAISAGHLQGTDQPAMPFLARELAEAPDPMKAGIRLQHLLEMTSGIDWQESLNAGQPRSAIELERSRDWVRYILAQPMKQPPGTAFDYNSGNSHLLSAIVTRATGMPTEKFAARALFGPMGITDYDWNVDPTGISSGGWGLQMTTRDMAKIGHLYLRGGAWDGTQLLPRAWVDRIHRPTVPMNLGTPDEFFHVDGWWAAPKRGMVMLAGVRRQIILLYPAKDLVVVTTGRASWRFERFFDLVERAVRSDAAR